MHSQLVSQGPIPDLLTVRQFVAKHRFVTEAGLRFHLFHRQTNNLVASGAVVCLGRKVLIDEVRFFEWLRAQQKGGAHEDRK